WQAPRDGVVRVTGTLRHDSEAGDGVRARIVSSRDGELGQWKVHKGQTETTVARVRVQRGDTLDFLVDCHKSIDSDDYKWAPTVRMIEEAPAGQAEGGATVWEAAADFQGPALTPWEQYAQVLLLANEFIFID